MELLKDSLRALGVEEVRSRDFVLVDFPGVVKNVDKALDMLGGLETVAQTHFADRPIELRHNPDNPFASCMVADKKISAKITSGSLQVVLRVRRKKNDPSHVEVSTTYTFDSMADFQYLPIRRRTNEEEDETGEKEALYDDHLERLVPHDIPSAMAWFEQEESSELPTPLFLPPYQFSRYNTPSMKVLGREVDFSVEKTKRRSGHGQSLRIERKALSVVVQANDPFPAEPSADAVADAENRCKNAEPHRMMKELFEERPMWTRIAILYRTGLDDVMLKTLLQKFAFYVLSGPWGRLWCRFGYDPRLDPTAKKYQTIMVSFRMHKNIPERQRLRVAKQRATAKGSRQSAFSQSVAGEKDTPVNYAYNPGELPRVRQIWYSLMDVHLSEAAELLEKSAFDHFDPVQGWVSSADVDRVRAAVKADVKKTSTVMDPASTSGEWTGVTIDDWD